MVYFFWAAMLYVAWLSLVFSLLIIYFLISRLFFEVTSDLLNRTWEEAILYKTNLRVRMAHELRTPLYSTVSAIDLLQKTSLQEWQLQLTKFIDHSARYMLSIVSGMLDSDKLLTGHAITYEKTHTNLKDIICSALDICKPAAIYKGVILLADFAMEPRTMITTDPLRFHLVLISVIMSAITASPIGNLARVECTYGQSEISSSTSCRVINLTQHFCGFSLFGAAPPTA